MQHVHFPPTNRSTAFLEVPALTLRVQLPHLCHWLILLWSWSTGRLCPGKLLETFAHTGEHGMALLTCRTAEGEEWTQHLNVSGFCGLVYMLQQIKHGYISRVCLSLASVWDLQNCYSWSCTQMISVLFIAAGAAAVIWLELYSLGLWFLYIWLAGAMLFRWVASPPINVFCYTISYIVRYHFHKSLLVGSFLLPLEIVPAIICILFCMAS